MLVVQILGRLRVWRDGDEVDLGSQARRAVLGLLALTPDKPVRRHDLIDAMWGDDPPASAVNVLQTHVKHLRRTLEPGRPARAASVVLPSTGDGYRLHLAGGSVDVVRFRDLAAAAIRATANPSRAVELSGAALAQWHGRRVLSDVPLLTRLPAVTRLTDERRRLLAIHAELLINLGRAREVLTTLAEDADDHPLDESVHALLVRALAATGQRARAAETYRAMRDRLADELGVPPGVTLRSAYEQVGGAGPSRTPAAGATGPPGTRRAPVPRQLPAEVTDFAGRADELRQLDTAGPLILLCGTPGVGKTALAVCWAHRVRSRFPDGQLFVDLRGFDADRSVSAGDALALLLSMLGVPDGEIPTDPQHRMARFRSAVADRRLLILLDNAGSVEQIRPLLPGTASCTVVITSRAHLGGLAALHGARRVEINPLPVADAVGLLRRLIGDRVAAAPASAATLVEQCARLPLALRVAAELVVARPGRPLADLVAELADRQRRLDLLDLGDDPRAAVREVISWSYQRLPAVAATAFRRLGLLPAAVFDGHLLAVLTETKPANGHRLAGVLSQAHLVQATGDGRLTQHDLLRAYATELVHRIDTDDDRRATIGRLLDCYLAHARAATRLLYPSHVGQPADPCPTVGHPDGTATCTMADIATNIHAARTWLDSVRPALDGLGSAAVHHGFTAQAIGLALALQDYLTGGPHDGALAVQRHGLSAARAAGDRVAEATLLSNIGDIHRLLGQYGPAVEQHRRALAMHRTAGNDRGAARTLTRLGIVLERIGDHGAATRRHRQAVAVYRRLGDRTGEASALVNLANALSAGDRLDLAADALDRARDTFRDLDERVGEASALANLGEVLTRLGRYQLASTALNEALALFRRAGHRDGEATALSNLGTVNTHLGAFDTAVRQSRTALAIFQASGHQYGQASALNVLGSALLSMGSPAQARHHYAEALTIAQATGDTDEMARARAGIAMAQTSES
ncbi:AfsR/SARP family transcriptional regulator [Micromonospora zingiberis]|uniref:AfsR/SARP family transcriptional regulator n=1 Tax=Micromonospora zingiberis TaxID=2053011 RepID=UPI0013F3AECF|nr:tetratricopeptide repeat protein [Micromonospora zingiberis]